MKILPYFVVGLLLLSGFAAISIGKEASVNKIGNPNVFVLNNVQNVKETETHEIVNLQFSNPVVTQTTIDAETFVEVDVSGADRQLYRAGEPMLPFYTKSYKLPFGTKIKDVSFSIQGEVKTLTLQHKVIPAPQAIPVAEEIEQSVEYILDDAIYNSDELFPQDWVTYYAGGGRDENNDPTTFLNVIVYPGRYSPATDKINYIEGGELSITYEEPLIPVTFGDSYDMVIICPSAFSSELQKLVTHKNSVGVSTTIKTLGDIYNEYSGVDEPEQIKYFIKDARETWGIDYVLLVGGLDSLLSAVPKDDRNKGVADWHVPVRYTNLRDDGKIYDPGYISDLYYADIYDSEGNFSEWDSNGDGIFAKWYGVTGKDSFDHYPDVYVGRLACRNKFEVKISVSRIINYESGLAGSWYDNMILVAGDSHDDAGTNYVEGELVTEYIWSNYMSGFNPVKVYATNQGGGGLVPTSGDIRKAINAGAGHLLFDGHGNPASWTTHYPFPDGGDWTGGIQIFQFPLLFNGKKLPVTIVGGCHNSQFNVSLLWTLSDKDNSQHTWCYGMPVPECFGWWLARKVGGGSIATMANTGLGYGALGEHGDLDGDGDNQPDTIERFGGYQQVCFYKTFDEGADILGEAWGGACAKYLDTFPPMDYQIDAKTVQQWVLFGDPSLKIGGRPPASGLKVKIVGGEAGILVDRGETASFTGIAVDGQAPYTYKWDLDEDGYYDDGNGQTVSKTWNTHGVYWASLKVTDANGDVDIYDTVVATNGWWDPNGLINFYMSQSQPQSQQITILHSIIQQIAFHSTAAQQTMPTNQ